MADVKNYSAGGFFSFCFFHRVKTALRACVLVRAFDFPVPAFPPLVPIWEYHWLISSGLIFFCGIRRDTNHSHAIFAKLQEPCRLGLLREAGECVEKAHDFGLIRKQVANVKKTRDLGRIL